jgi:hypothetical protein
MWGYNCLYLPKFKKMNIAKLQNIIQNVHLINAIILYGSCLIKWFPKDIDILIIRNNILPDNKIEKVIIPKESPKVHTHYGGGVYLSSYQTIGNTSSHSYTTGEYNPYPIDITSLQEQSVFQDLKKNREGNLSNTVCLNALKWGIVLAMKEKYDITKFGIKNESQYSLILQDDKLKIRKKR